MGNSVNQLIRDYLEHFIGKRDSRALAEGFDRLSSLAHGDRRGWNFNRDEIHERKF